MFKRNHRPVFFAGLTLLVAVGLAGCSLSTVTIDLSDHGTIQRMNVGDLLVIRLMGNATTGYEWARVTPETLDSSPIDPIDESGYQTLGTEPVGAPGEFIFRYRAIRPGTVRIKFEYRRPWEANESIDSFEVTVWVR